MKKSLTPPKYFFNELGLRFSVQFLTLMKKEIHLLGLKEQSEFVDMATYDMTIRNRKIVLPGDVRKVYFQNINVTSIGNAAFIALYHPTEIQRQNAIDILTAINKYKIQQILNTLENEKNS